MVSVRKRKMARSSVKKATRRMKDRQRQVRNFGNSIIAANWDPKLSLSQNYEKMGLKVRLSQQTGGVEKKITPQFPESDDEFVVDETEEEEEERKSDSKDSLDPADIPEGTAKLVRDDEGNVIKVIYGTKKLTEEVQEEKPPTEVVKKLEELAQQKVVKERKQSAREVDWLADLYNKYGDDYEKMKWDKKLNPYQHSAGELKKRITKWKKTQGLST
ncbi:hypothetical protein KL930_004652 [Ogataea haglerorum]|uniref:Nucleolar protein 16 n=1 Tax=Ogataea haglerorum TaxID=1937702 RepID=A0AAN6D262_9ASCO|nr:uncharacterized protein KL911_000482 [Ogataea haglerorum]KAG7699300.1 hypothetical protein KL915_001592 [Ogataea haglerorum]KAG7700902.1 hypothetical protein KL951_001017 [Ogataea haglerorum]KAG7710342.1 hypothetical protein KL914_001252 [Ogataea haglerorum]KAG7710877.1 hypothetical protein KL950_000843 [Ogataea haglerorum]KAG7725020.1 hypothetical protein KL933_004453 [Ogataea haglerorum]